MKQGVGRKQESRTCWAKKSKSKGKIGSKVCKPAAATLVAGDLAQEPWHLAHKWNPRAKILERRGGRRQALGNEVKSS